MKNKQSLNLQIKNLLGLAPEVNSMSGSARNDRNDKYKVNALPDDISKVKKMKPSVTKGIKKKKMVNNTFSFRKNKSKLPEMHQY